MKKMLAASLLLTMACMTAACGTVVGHSAVSAPASSNAVSTAAPLVNEAVTPISLTINGTPFKAYLNGSKAAQSLKAQLPRTVRLNDSDNDFCGDSLRISYGPGEVQKGYKNGDIAFWPPASNFVIFKNGEESSADTGNLVILGHITEPQSKLDALHGTLTVEISEAK